MKKTIYSLTILITFTGLMRQAVPAFAQNLGGQRVINQVNHAQNQASRTAARQSTQLQNIINHSDLLIANRISTLNALLNKVQTDAKLSASEKSSLSSQIQLEISGITALKSKIDTDTDVATARIDERLIITDYYVYAIFDPKIRLLIILNNLQTVTSNVQALVPQLQNLINTFKAQGKDVTQLQNLLNDVSTQLQTISATLTSDVTTIENVSVTTQGASTIFAKTRQDIAQIVRADFARIRSDFAQMIPLFTQIIRISQQGASQSANQTTTITPASSSANQ